MYSRFRNKDSVIDSVGGFFRLELNATRQVTAHKKKFDQISNDTMRINED